MVQGDEGKPSLVDQERGKRPQEAPQNRVRSQEVKGKNDALNLFPAYFSGGRQGVRFAVQSTPLTERFSGDEPKQPLHRHKRGKKGYVETMIYLDNSNQR